METKNNQSQSTEVNPTENSNISDGLNTKVSGSPQNQNTKGCGKYFEDWETNKEFPAYEICGKDILCPECQVTNTEKEICENCGKPKHRHDENIEEHDGTCKEFEPEEMTAEKTYKILTWVEVEVFAEVKAKNKESALRKAKKLNNFDFTAGNWLSGVQEKGFEVVEIEGGKE